MKQLMLFVAGTLFSSLAMANAKWDAKDIGECMRANAVQRGGVRQLEIVTTDRSGAENSLALNIFWSPDKSATKISMQVTQPDSLAGSAYLLRESRKDEDEFFVYVPSIGKPRKITGAARGEQLWGTAFSYDEFKLIQGLALTSPTTRAADATVSGRTTYVLESTVGSADAGTRKVRTYVDQKSCTVLKGELFGSDGKLAKNLDGDISMLFQTSDYDDRPIWLLLGYTLKDIASGTQSTIRLGEIHLLEKAPASLFDPDSFFKTATASKK